ncbi:hypothetical protein Tco_1115414 [Tanacetum coccineum]
MSLLEKVWIGVSTVDTFSANGCVDELEAEMLQGQKLQSHDFTATHGSNIVIDGTAERGISVKRRELNYESMSEPELQVPFSSVSLPEDIGSSAGDVGKSACSLYVSSLGGCVPDVEAPIVAESLLQMDNVNVPVVSSSDHSMSQADVTGALKKPDLPRSH